MSICDKGRERAYPCGGESAQEVDLALGLQAVKTAQELAFVAGERGEHLFSTHKVHVRTTGSSSTRDGSRQCSADQAAEAYLSPMVSTATVESGCDCSLARQINSAASTCRDVGNIIAEIIKESWERDKLYYE